MLLESQHPAIGMDVLRQFQSGEVKLGAQVVQNPEDTPMETFSIVFAGLQSNFGQNTPS